VNSTHEDCGASAVEYGLMIAAIAAVIVGLTFTLGNTVQAAFSKTNTCLQSSLQSSGTC
jgi:pilus assembly protein Flp/PilA